MLYNIYKIGFKSEAQFYYSDSVIYFKPEATEAVHYS